MMDRKNDKSVIQSVIKREDVSISANVEEKYIFTTEDKIKLLYNEYNSAKKYTGNILSQVGICLTLWTAIFTCDFKSIFGISPESIKAVFIMGAIISTVVLCYTSIQRYRNRHKLTFEFFFHKIQGIEEKPKDSLFRSIVEKWKKNLFRVEEDSFEE